MQAKVVKFRIRSFRSIQDTGDCLLASDLSIFAGKNEAGKTNIFVALKKFNLEEEFTEDDYNLDYNSDSYDDSHLPSVSVTYKFGPDLLKEYLNEIGIKGDFDFESLAATPLTITKVYDGNYYLEGPLNNIINNRKSIKELSKTFGITADELIKIGQKHHKYTSAELSQIKDIEEYSKTKESIQSLMDHISTIDQSDSDKYGEIISHLNTRHQEYIKLTDQIDSRVIAFIELLPQFMLFDGFDNKNLLQYEITIADAMNNEAVKNYCLIAGVNLKIVAATTDSQKRKKLINEKSSKIEGEFGDYWTQDSIHLRMEPHGADALQFTIKESNRTHDFQMAQRSKGFQWFLSFYLLIKAAARSNYSVLLIDEPGLYVHAQAQQSILTVLQDLVDKEENQVMFSTHSPYLIDPKRLDRIRLVMKNHSIGSKNKKTNKGTKVYELSQVQTNDKETLTPIITAIGLDISKGLTLASDKNVLLEGISDYYYLSAFIKILSKQIKQAGIDGVLNDIHFIPATGVTQIPLISSIMIGWSLKHKVVVDNDDAGRNVANELSEKLQIKDSDIVKVLDTSEAQIEDLFTSSDFDRAVLDITSQPTEDHPIQNSTKIADIRKIILAREFYNKADSTVKLSKETKDNFFEILKKLTDWGE
jgi:AAA15 family ATPase/GTPase